VNLVSKNFMNPKWRERLQKLDTHLQAKNKNQSSLQVLACLLMELGTKLNPSILKKTFKLDQWEGHLKTLAQGLGEDGNPSRHARRSNASCNDCGSLHRLIRLTEELVDNLDMAVV